MLDGCGIGSSAIIQGDYIVDRCNHKQNIYVKPSSVVEDVNFKVHNNLSENSHKNSRKNITRYYGIKALGSDKSITSNLKKYLDEEDWKANYTNRTSKDCLLMFGTFTPVLWLY